MNSSISYLLLSLLDDMLMVIGGHGDNGDFSTVELVSLDPVNNPVPECLTDLTEIPATSGIAAASVGMSGGKTVDRVYYCMNGFINYQFSSWPKQVIRTSKTTFFMFASHKIFLYLASWCRVYTC